MKRKTMHYRSIGYCAILLVLIVMSCNKDDGPAEVLQTDSEQQADPEPQNRSPLANAGDNRQEEIGTLVKLDGSLSSDPDGDALTYNWSFSSLPDGSTATLIGVGKDIAEFTMDKAGDYLVQLVVGDGTAETKDSVMVSNKKPEMLTINTFTDGNLEDDIAQRGRNILIEGEFFSPDVEENKVTLAGSDCEVDEINLYPGGKNPLKSILRVKVPENAISGDLVIMVGSQSTTWPMPIRLIENPPVTTWIENEPTLVEKERPLGTYRDIGTVFKPLVNGQLVAMGARSAVGQNVLDKPRLTLWDMVTEAPLVTLELGSTGSYIRYYNLDEPLPLVANKAYGVTFASNDWYAYETDPKTPIFPKTIGQIELVKHIQTGVFNDPLTDLVFPDEASLSYLTQGVDILFVPDTE